jgi:mono/diheme cytochrome c family protein
MAKQNCLRCHNAGPYGGTKAGWSWETLSVVAKADPKTFKNYVHDPKSVNAKAKMPANPQYDAATLAVLAAYFQSLTKK